MSAGIVTIQTMQAEHKTWLAAHADWRRDIERWQAEHRSARDRLDAMGRLIREHGDALEEHARDLQEVDTAIAAHDRDIAGYQAGTGTQAQDVLANRHRDNEGIFSRQLDAHERIKKHHENVMARLRNLELSAEAAM